MRKGLWKLFLVLVLGYVGYTNIPWFQDKLIWNTQSSSIEKRVWLEDDGVWFEVRTRADTIANFLQQQSLVLGDGDNVFPSPEKPLFSGTKIYIERSKSIVIATKDGKKEWKTFQKTVEQAVREAGIELGEEDFALPGRNNPPFDGMQVTVIRVRVEEKVVDKPIPFETVVTEDEDLSWRKRLTDQKGENGIRRFTYKIWSHDGKEVDRKLLSQEVAKEPVTEKITQGTFVKVGKAHTGLGTWYAYTGTLAAASPWLPMGSYVKVTNRDNGKTVIVKINDRGPFGKNRILDLDRVAFEKIASLGAGVINLKVEEITN